MKLTAHMCEALVYATQRRGWWTVSAQSTTLAGLRRRGLVEERTSRLTVEGEAMRTRLCDDDRAAEGTVRVPVWALRVVLASWCGSTDAAQALAAALDARGGEA
ncbi:MAG TPA: hypothetical protein VI911_04135 [Patescibacteria group bacterium]|nr:hypothetical protein [Patescibacteria group bacterium]